jgi:3-oxoacyl-[acyl-carrier protein] reductase
MKEFMKKVIVITGASRGIGKQCAISLAQKDTVLVLMATKLDNLKDVSKQCTELGAIVEDFAVDLTNYAHVHQLIKDIANKYHKIDVLINNAGIWLEKNFLEGDMSLWDHALDTNLKSVMHITRYCLDNMSTNGSIIFIGSTASRKTYAGGTNYCAAKFGLLGFANSLFEDIREKGIKVCTILPGVVNTDMHKDDDSFTQDKMIQPEDVASTVKFVLSMPGNVCPTEITLMPQKNPKIYK